jgi:orotate phosphoribosyltransferase
VARSRKERTERARPELLELLKTLAYRRGIFTLASGKKSDFFIDCKQAVLTAVGHQLVGELMLDALRHLPQCDAIAGVALGGCPLASAVSLMSQIRQRPLPALYVRKAAKDHGTQRLVEGQLTPGMRVVMLEDVCTTGGSTLAAVQVLRNAGATVVGVVVLVDRLEGGLENLQREGLEVVALYTRHDFVEDIAPLSATLSDSTLGD